MSANVFHATSSDAAGAIMREGFRDATGSYLTAREFTGVWVSDVPLDENTVQNAIIIVIELPSLDFLAEWEWVEDVPFSRHREWLVPASVLHQLPRRIHDEAEGDFISQTETAP